MEKTKIFWGIITCIISIIILLLIINLLFKSDSINEGKFRVSDVILTSTAEVTNSSKDSGMWKINISQNNKLSMLIVKAPEADISEIYVSDMSASRSNIIFSQAAGEQKIKLNESNEKLKVEYEVTEDSQILLEFTALNENILKDWQVPEDVKLVVYDGRIFETAGIKLSDIDFKLKFKLNIVEKSGKKNTLNITMDLPTRQLLDNGADIRRLNKADFKFKVN